MVEELGFFFIFFSILLNGLSPYRILKRDKELLSLSPDQIWSRLHEAQTIGYRGASMYLDSRNTGV